MESRHQRLGVTGSRIGKRSLRVASLTALTVFGAANPALAQSLVHGDFSAQRFDPAAGPRNYFVTRGARQDGAKTWSFGAFGSYAREPLTNDYCKAPSADGTGCQGYGTNKIVEHLISAHLLASYTVMPRLQLSLTLPVTSTKGQGIDPTDGSAVRGGLKGTGLGDPMVEAKYRFLGQSDSPLVLGGGLFVGAPLGHAMNKDDYIGDGSITGGARGIIDLHFGAFGIAGNVVGFYRKPAHVGASTIGKELRYSVAAGYQLGPVIRIIAEGIGASRLSTKADGTNALEILGGLQITPMGLPFAFTAGAGTGIIEGVGVPKLRGFAGIVYIAEGKDRDKDGIPDNVDQCQLEPEDMDGHEDSDGCPDRDNDDDRFEDSVDQCPDQAEDKDGFKDDDGCPDLDNDKDGIPDERDVCPMKPETKNGFKDEDGCPDEADKDSDGVPDSRDKCPDQAEDTDGFQDEDGCPDADNDGDGIPDTADECSEEPETKNGFEDTDGCPDDAKEPTKKPKKAPKPAAPAKKVVDMDE